MLKRYLKKSKKGVIAIYISFIIMAIFLTVVAGLLAPVGVRINSEIYLAGQKILNESSSNIANITNAEIRASVQGTLNEAIGQTANNIEIDANIYRYGWIFILGISAISVFIITRRNVEYGGNVI